jgi:hypothetical protein
MANGMSTAPIASSNGASLRAFGEKIERIVGATVRWSQAIGLPAWSMPASSRSTDAV